MSAPVPAVKPEAITWRCETHGLSDASCCDNAYYYAHQSLAQSATELQTAAWKLAECHANLARRVRVWRKQIGELQRALERHREEVERLRRERYTAQATAIAQGKRLGALVDEDIRRAREIL